MLAVVGKIMAPYRCPWLCQSVLHYYSRIPEIINSRKVLFCLAVLEVLVLDWMDTLFGLRWVCQVAKAGSTWYSKLFPGWSESKREKETRIRPLNSFEEMPQAVAGQPRVCVNYEHDYMRGLD